MSSSVLTIDDKQMILDSHNWIRAHIAKGVYGLPPTSNMIAMDWSEEMEQKSVIFSTKCSSISKYHYQMKVITDLPYVTLTSKSLEFSNQFLITSLIKNIVGQLNSSINFQCKGKIICQIIDQILEPYVSSIGCSVKQCQPYINILTCVYNKRSLLKSFLDSDNIGYPCSNCSTRHLNCLNNVLCASESQCFKTQTKQCSCLVSKETCLNHGIFIADKCLCVCKPGYKGINCQDRCIDNWKTCEQSKEKCFFKSTEGRNFKKNCLKTCGFCSNAIFTSSISRSSLMINTNKSPFNLETKSKKINQCDDKLWQCQNWVKMGLCFMKTVRSTCAKSCQKCESDEQLISYYRDLLMMKDANKDCVDTRSECQMWADKNYCYIKSVQIYCPRVCALCPDPPDPEKFLCEEIPPRSATCQQVFGNHLCYSPDMKEVCPVTCGNVKCGTPLPTTTLKDPCIEPESHKKPCSDFKKVGYCSLKEVIEYCPVTCEIDKCKADPELCKDLKSLCSTEKIKEKCKQTCGTTMLPSTTLKSTLISTIFDITEPPLCSNMKDLCSNPTVKTVCKKTCISSKTSKSSTSGSSVSSTSGTSISSTPLSTEPSSCPMMKDLCTNPGVQGICKKTCATSTTPKSSTSGSSVSSTSGTSISSIPLSTEPSICPSMKDLCINPGVQALCKHTCATSTKTGSTNSGTSESKAALTTEPSVCPSMKDLCITPGVKTLCKKTCATSTTPLSSTSGTSGSTTPLSTEPSVCPSMKDLCITPGVKALCKKTCATSTTPLSSTSGTSGSTTPLSTEPTVCPSLKGLCITPGVKALCKMTCATSSSPLSISISSSSMPPVSSSKSDLTTKQITCSPVTGLTESPQCSKMAMHCNNIGVKDLCPITCGECTSTVLQHTEDPTTFGISTEFSGCEQLKSRCSIPGVATLCPKACAG